MGKRQHEVTSRWVRRQEAPRTPKGTWPARFAGCNPAAVDYALEVVDQDWSRLEPGMDGSVVIDPPRRRRPPKDR